MKRLVAIVVGVSLSVCGCVHVLDAASRTAGQTIGESVGTAVGDRVVRGLSPMVMTWYTNSLFAMAFGSGGYAVGETDYEPGEWTRWRWSGDNDEGWLERAYLGPDGDREWWRVKLYDADEDESFVVEGLFTADLGELLRMRRQFPGDEEPVEVPVQKDQYYVPPTTLTDESIEGAKVETSDVTVPAGTFTADHIRFGSAQGGTWEWWLTDAVPGSIVMYANRAGSQSAGEPDEDAAFDPHDYQMVLVDFGDGAESMLGVK